MGLRLISGPTAEPISVTEFKNHARISTSAEDALCAVYISAARKGIEVWQRRAHVCQTWALTLNKFPNTGEPIELPINPVIGVTSITYVDTAGATQTWAASNYQADINGIVGTVRPVYGGSYASAREQPNSVTITFTAGYSTPFTTTHATELLTLSGRNPADDERVRLWNTGGALPAGFSTATDYYTISSSTNTCKLSTTSGGSAAAITGDGTGTHFLGEFPEITRAAIMLWASHLYEHREPVITGTIVAEMPLSVKSLIYLDCIPGAA